VKPIAEMSLEELAAFVSTHLANHGISVVLVGGSCVSIYTNNQYLSKDLDYIELERTSRRKMESALKEINFTTRNRYFTHPDCEWFLEFPSGPITLGDQAINEFSRKESETGIFFMLTATDCVKDRLAAYFHWNDNQALDQAINVATDNPVDLADIEHWSNQEDSADKYQRFIAALKQ